MADRYRRMPPPPPPFRPPNGQSQPESKSLFVKSTISKDDTSGVVAKEAELLAGAHRRSDNLPPAPFLGNGLSKLPTSLPAMHSYGSNPMGLGPTGPGSPMAKPSMPVDPRSSIGGPPQYQYQSPRPPSLSHPPPPPPPPLPRTTYGPGHRAKHQFNLSEAVRDSIGTGNGQAALSDNPSGWREAMRHQREERPIIADTAPQSQLADQDAPSNTVQEPFQPAMKPNLSFALSAIADEYLGLDILDDNQSSSQYIAFLIDVIHNLQTKLEFQKKASKETKKIPDLPQIEVVGEKERHPEPCFLVLHRVFCQIPYHGHNAAVYEDVPQLMDPDGEPLGSEMLCGKVEIKDIEAYLRKQKDVQFVIYKEYRCEHSNLSSIRRLRADVDNLKGHFDEYQSGISTRQERMSIVSPLLQRAINAVAMFKLDTFFFEDSTGESEEIRAPYHFFFHHRRKLEEFIKERPNHESSVRVLLDYLESNFHQEYAEADKMFSEGLTTDGTIDKLFTPGQIVVTEDKGTFKAYVLDKWPVKLPNSLLFSGWQWVYDGRTFQRQSWHEKLDLNFLDAKRIETLKVRPIEYVEESIRAEIRERGRRFWAMKRQSLVSYDGWDHHHEYLYDKERFMVDMATYMKMHPESRLPPAWMVDEEFDRFPQRITQDDEITDDELLMLPPTMHGYCLREKKWVTINIDQMSDVFWNKQAFRRLVLEEETKDVLRALIDVRMSDSKKLDDLVVGKGNGLIMLLHGSPGTGKSLTAESVAEFAEKPLYRVTCGDIGTDAAGVEKYLETILYLAKIWDCVLLLDEADVFLEERSVSDLQRNSLVSVFLRVLEYYEGIMILTSNRVGTFDEAFQSRIRVALRYEPLTFQSRKAIWQNFFEMLVDDDKEIKVSIRGLDDRLEQLAGYKMNGRQIRNILLTARQLALHRRGSLEWKDLEQALVLSDNFSRYLQEIKGVSDEAWAKSQSLR